MGPQITFYSFDKTLLKMYTLTAGAKNSNCVRLGF